MRLTDRRSTGKLRKARDLVPDILVVQRLPVELEGAASLLPAAGEVESAGLPVVGVVDVV